MAVDLSFITAPGPAGVAASIIVGAAAGRMRVTGLTGMTLAMVGKKLGLSASVHPTNNGVFTIAAFVSATTVDVTNAAAVIPDAGPLQWVEISGANNNWVIRPSGDDSKDSDNFQFVFTQSQLVTVATSIPATLSLAAGTFYCRKEVEIADWRGFIQPQTTNPTVIFGTVAGGGMDFLSPSKALFFNPSTLPDGWVFYELVGGIGSSVTIKNINFATNPSVNGTVGMQSVALRGIAPTGLAPWDNFACNRMIHGRGILGEYKCGCVGNITAPDGANKQTLTSIGALFVASDVGKTLINYDSLQPNNNGPFVITDFIDANNIKFVNQFGVADIGNNAWAIIPNPYHVGRIDMSFDGCTFTGHYGDPVNDYNGSPLTNCAGAIEFDEEYYLSVMEGISIGPYTLNAPDATLPQFPNQGDLYQYAQLGGRYFYFNNAHAPKNGNLTVNNCQFSQVGWPVHVLYVWATNQGHDFLAMPSPAVTPQITITNNVATDCGLNPQNGGGGACFLVCGIVNHGNTVVDNNRIVFSNFGQFDSQMPQNNLRGISLVGAIATFVPDPTSFVFFCHPQGGIITAVGRPPPSVQITNNDVNMGLALKNGKESASCLFFWGIFNPSGAPIDVYGSCVVSHNKLTGLVRSPIIGIGQSNVSIAYNELQGDANNPQISLNQCTNFDINNNTFDTKPKFNVFADSQVDNCSFSDTIGGSPTLLDLGANKSKGYMKSNDSSQAPSNPTGAPLGKQGAT